jgi:adenosine deaminase CECR1
MSFRRIPPFFLTALIIAGPLAASSGFSARFEQIRSNANPAQLFALMYATPKAGDLHHHAGGCWRMEDVYHFATNAQNAGGARFYTRLRAGECDGETNRWVRFATISGRQWNGLTPCQRDEYAPLESLTPAQRDAWLSALRLDQPGEGRDEFFEEIWPRLGALSRDPYVSLEMLVATMKRYGAEGVRYIEPQVSVENWEHPDGTPVASDDAASLFAARLARPDAVATGVAVRFQIIVLRFTPIAERKVEDAFTFIDRHRDLFVGVNMAGREDNNHGYPRRFLETYRKLRHRYSGIGLAIHGGEADEPNEHGRDTLLLGATRIGHGVNLIRDDDLMLHLRAGIALVEINLVSNLLLEYVRTYADHPFAEYLRTGVPVALSTDDSGMWDSGMTEEYYTAVTEFHVTWDELKAMARNSLSWSFAEPALKAKLIADFEHDTAAFEQRFDTADWAEKLKAVKPVAYGFAKRRWGLEFPPVP